MADGREELTRKEMTELKWAIFFVNPYPDENSIAIDEALERSKDETIKINESIKTEMNKWRGWNGMHKIHFKHQDSLWSV